LEGRHKFALKRNLLVFGVLWVSEWRAEEMEDHEAAFTIERFATM